MQWWERSPPTHIWVRFWLHMWVELNMVGSRPCSEGFPPVFLASKKQHFKTVDKKSHPVECPLLNSYFLIPISLFIPTPICPAYILIIRNKWNWSDHLHYHYHICHHVNFRLWRLIRIGWSHLALVLVYVSKKPLKKRWCSVAPLKVCATLTSSS